MPRPEVTRTSGFNSFKGDQFIGHFMRHRNEDIAVCAVLYRIGNIPGFSDDHFLECFPHRTGIKMYATVHD
jgi:hypothetical protein